MSTSYKKFIYSLVGVLLISPIFAQTSRAQEPPTPEWLECSYDEDGLGVKAIVHISDMAALEKKELKKDKAQYMAEVLALKKNGRCNEAGNELSCDQANCPSGEMFLCGKNAGNNLDSNHPLLAGAPMGTDHGCIELTSKELHDYGLIRSLERHKSEFDPTEYGFIKSGKEKGQYRRSITLRDDNTGITSTIQVYDATSEYSKGETADHSVVPVHPQPPIPPAAPAMVIEETYKNGSPSMDCSGDLTCKQAEDCEKYPEKVFAETCAKSDNCGKFSFEACQDDYKTFCNAGAPVCGDDNKTNVPVPANIVSDARATANAIEALKKATSGMTDDSGVEVHVTKCGLLGAVTVPVHGAAISTTGTQAQYDACIKENNNDDPLVRQKVALRRDDLDYLEILLKAFANPGSVRPPANISGITPGFLTHLAKLEGLDAPAFFKALKISNPSPAAIEAYDNLVASLVPIVGKTGAPSDMNGTVLKFVKLTNGGMGYLGVTPPGSVSQTYIDILNKLKNNDSSPLCMRIPDPPYAQKDYPQKYSEFQKNYLKAIVRDHNIAERIAAKLKDCQNKEPALPPANTKAHRRTTSTQ